MGQKLIHMVSESALSRTGIHVGLQVKRTSATASLRIITSEYS